MLSLQCTGNINLCCVSHWDLGQLGLYSIYNLSSNHTPGNSSSTPTHFLKQQTASWISNSFIRTDCHTAAASSTQWNFLSEQKGNIVGQIHEMLREWIPSVISKDRVYYCQNSRGQRRSNQTSTCSQIKSECLLSYRTSSWLLEFLSLIGCLASSTDEPGLRIESGHRHLSVVKWRKEACVWAE